MISLNFWKKLFFIPFLLLACSEENELSQVTKTGDSEKMETINLSEKLGLNGDDVKMFTMPTPIQVAAALKVMDMDYNESLLLENGKINLSSNIYLSLSLGMFLTDLGYTVVHNNHQKSLDYAIDVQYIMENLPIPTYINNGFKSRFKANIENRDSLTKIILEGYYEANQHITQTHNEGMGLLILAGSYIEGLHLSTSYNSSNWTQEYDNMLIQQKLFLNNFLTLLDGYTSNTTIAIVVEKLTQLKVVFDEIEIRFNDQTESHELVKPISSKDITKINDLIKVLRNDIIQQSH